MRRALLFALGLVAVAGCVDLTTPMSQVRAAPGGHDASLTSDAPGDAPGDDQSPRDGGGADDAAARDLAAAPDTSAADSPSPDTALPKDAPLPDTASLSPDTAPPARDTAPPDGVGKGLVGYWKLDEGAGTTCADSSGNGNDGALSGGAWQAGGFPAAKFANPGSLKLDGVKGYVDAGTRYTLANLRPLTVTAWVKIASDGKSSYTRILDKKHSAKGWSLFNSTGALYFEQSFSVKDGVWQTGNDIITYDFWHHVAVAYNGSSSQNRPALYIDGVLMNAIQVLGPSGTASDDAAQPLYIGNLMGESRTMDGVVDDVRVYNRLLSGAEVASLAAGNQ